MKAKLFKVKTFRYENGGDYYDNDKSDIIKHLVESHSDFEDVDDTSALERYVKDFNSRNKEEGSYLMIAYQDAPTSIKSAIKEILEVERVAEENRMAEIKRRATERDREIAKAKLEKEEKARERKRKQLEKLKKELESEGK